MGRQKGLVSCTLGAHKSLLLEAASTMCPWRTSFLLMHGDILQRSPFLQRKMLCINSCSSTKVGRSSGFLFCWQLLFVRKLPWQIDQTYPRSA